MHFKVLLSLSATAMPQPGLEPGPFDPASSRIEQNCYFSERQVRITKIQRFGKSLPMWIRDNFKRYPYVTFFMQLNIKSLSDGRLLEPFSVRHDSLCNAWLITWIASYARATERSWRNIIIIIIIIIISSSSSSIVNQENKQSSKQQTILLIHLLCRYEPLFLHFCFIVVSNWAVHMWKLKCQNNIVRKTC